MLPGHGGERGRQSASFGSITPKLLLNILAPASSLSWGAERKPLPTPARQHRGCDSGLSLPDPAGHQRYSQLGISLHTQQENRLRSVFRKYWEERQIFFALRDAAAPELPGSVPPQQPLGGMW